MTTVESTDPDPEICQTCDNSRAWHEANKPMHPFNDGQAGATAFLGRRDQRREPGPQRGSEAARLSQRAAYPIDPVLRQALVDKGVLTPQDLKDAEDKIQAITGLFHQSNLPVTRGGPS